MNRLARATALALLAGAAGGCPAGGLRTGRALTLDQVRRIAPSRTTKADLFALLGTPTAIVGPGEQALAPSPSARASVEGERPDRFLQDGTYPLQGDALLTLFAEAAARDEALRVYHYASTHEHGWFFVFPVFFGVESYTTRVDELYVLVDERTEKVEGVVFRPAR